MSLRVGDCNLKTLAGTATRPTVSRVREALFNIWQNRVSGCRWLDLCAGSGAIGAEAILRGAAFVVGVEQSGAACQIIKQNWHRICEGICKDHSSAQIAQIGESDRYDRQETQHNQNNSQPWQLHRGDALKVLPKLIRQIESEQVKAKQVNSERAAIAPNLKPDLELDAKTSDRPNPTEPDSHQASLKFDLFDLVYFDPPYQSDLYLPVLDLLPALLSSHAIVAAEHDRHKPLPDRVGELEVSDRRSYGSTGLTFYTLKDLKTS